MWGYAFLWKNIIDYLFKLLKEEIGLQVGICLQTSAVPGITEGLILNVISSPTDPGVLVTTRLTSYVSKYYAM